ncbi:MAG TPA: ATP-dependent DNA helicase RecG, partial [Gemmatales bacterium]|nr:ATP-dependent DNA helicase RecG [Gemmatales bacterium]
RTIAELQPGMLQTVVGEVVEMEGRTTASGKQLLSIVISDGQDVIEGVWFNQTFMARQLAYGMRVAFSGKPNWYRDHWQMSAPRVRPLRDDEATSENPIVPIYPLTQGLHAEAMRRIQRHVVETYAEQVEDCLPLTVRSRHDWPDLTTALRDMHMPPAPSRAEAARRRLAFEEFFILHVALTIARRDQQQVLAAPALATTEIIDAHIRQLFPFTLTRDQSRAIAQICKDMASERPMRRLLQADVGAGKTAVALYAMLLAVAHRHQAVLMAPTEVLARQHWRTVNEYLAQSRVRRSLLTGSLPPRQRRQTLGEIRMGQVDLVIGTQALIQNDVEFSRLGLVVIDEQHRFGVLQRGKVRQLGPEPHYLVMTATPIPRSIALTVFGDLDSTVIRELPPGRQPVVTKWVAEEKRANAYLHLHKELKRGQQLFVICPLVEESEGHDTKAAEQMYAELQASHLGAFRIGLLHGRLDDGVKVDVMNRFRERQLDILVATTVVEVGVDVPNATLMVIEHAERFGLSQLHQLRGRVSRGPVRGLCLLFAQATSPETAERLRLFVKTTNGFELAEHDLRLRGMGEFFGTRQHGFGSLRVAHLVKDQDLLSQAQADARELVQGDPGLRLPEHALLRAQVLRQYGDKLNLAAMG